MNGRRVTTQRKFVDLLITQCPSLHVEPDMPYVDEGQFVTASCSSSGLDMFVHLIRRDHGWAVAADVARHFVTPPKHENLQAQLTLERFPASREVTLEPLLRWLEENVGSDLTLDRIAAHARMSARTLNRRFLEETGTTPMRWLNLARIRRAQFLLEVSTDSVDLIAARVGFASPAAFRHRFKDVLGISPQKYRVANRS
jgi:transcriptional regulator GlxA family with amidase domain